MATTMRQSPAVFLLVSAALVVGIKGLCYWGPDGTQCDDHRGGAPGIQWNYNGPGNGPTGPDFPDQPGQQFCNGQPLPFGLENCQCDGAIAGHTAGLAGCQRVKQVCGSSNFQQFSGGQPTLEEVQRVCNDLSRSACQSTAVEYSDSDWQCRNLLATGNQQCTYQQARQVFQQVAGPICEPVSLGSDSDDSEDSDKSDSSGSCRETHGCTCNVWRTAAAAGEAGCHKVMEECSSSNPWGNSESNIPPCSEDLEDDCMERSWTWVPGGNSFCNWILTSGNGRCSRDEARKYFRDTVRNECSAASSD